MGRALLRGDATRGGVGSEPRGRRSSGGGGGRDGGVGPWEVGRPTVSRAGRLTLDTLLALGRELEQEQENVMRVRLVEEYMKGVKGLRGAKEADAAAVGLAALFTTAL
jgi:hypothetical protein